LVGVDVLLLHAPALRAVDVGLAQQAGVQVVGLFVAAETVVHRPHDAGVGGDDGQHAAGLARAAGLVGGLGTPGGGDEDGHRPRQRHRHTAPDATTNVGHEVSP